MYFLRGLLFVAIVAAVFPAIAKANDGIQCETDTSEAATGDTAVKVGLFHFYDSWATQYGQSSDQQKQDILVMTPGQHETRSFKDSNFDGLDKDRTLKIYYSGKQVCVAIAKLTHRVGRNGKDPEWTCDSKCVQGPESVGLVTFYDEVQLHWDYSWGNLDYIKFVYLL